MKVPKHDAIARSGVTGLLKGLQRGTIRRGHSGSSSSGGGGGGCRRGGVRDSFGNGVTSERAAVAVPFTVAVPTGALSGTLGSLCGIGGGVVVIPALTNFTSMTPHVVSASSLFVVSVSCTVAAASYLEQGFTNLPLALTLMSTSVPGSALGARLVSFVSASMLKRGTGLVMLASAPAIWVKSSKNEGSAVERAEELSVKEESVEQISARNRVQLADIVAVRPETAARYLSSHLDFVVLGLVTGLA